MLHSNDQALQGFKQSFSYATDATLKAVVRGNVIMGSEKHKVDGSVLTVQAALLEALENVIGQAEAMITGPRRQYCMWLLKVDGKDGPAWYLFKPRASRRSSGSTRRRRWASLTRSQRWMPMRRPTRPPSSTLA